MALKKPLVYGLDGHVQQLQAGDVLDIPDNDQDTFINGSGGVISKGQVVYQTVVAGTVSLARADAFSTTNGIALVFDTTIGIAASGLFQFEGVITNTDWTSVTGVPLLVPGSRYYLSHTTNGRLTLIPPTTSQVGNYVQEIGIALTTTKLRIDIKAPIKM